MPHFSMSGVILGKLTLFNQSEELMDLRRSKLKQTKKKGNKEFITSHQKLWCSCVSLLCKTVGSKEESSHPPTDALSVVQDVELVDELIHAIAGLGDGA